MITSTLVTYLSGLLIEQSNNIKDSKKSIKLKKLYLLTSLVINLGILFVFKYHNFFTSTLTRLLSIINISLQLPYFDFLLPVGISFYTFQALSYTIDVYRNDVKAERNFGKYALFVSFFPQLVAGPIEKSKDLLHQFDEKHYFSYEKVKNGLILMLWGLFQKVVVADRLALLVNTVYSNANSYKGFKIIIANIFFAFQIYCDFASYSNMARGAAEVMGFSLSLNFRQPYFSKSVKEFWRRWHITLSSWFKDYLYIPLGGNRCSKTRSYLNNMAVFLASGLWHGASINFIIWGALHGAYVVIGDLLKPLKYRTLYIFKINTTSKIYKLTEILFTFILVDFAWIFFRATSFTNAKNLIKNMLFFNPYIFTSESIYKLGLDRKDFNVALLSILIVLFVDFIQYKTDICTSLIKKPLPLRWFIYFSTIVFILIFGMYGSGYNPQQFIYFQF